MLSALQQHLGEGLVLFKYSCTQSQVHENYLSIFEHFLDELECHLQAWLSFLTPVSVITNAILDDWTHIPTYTQLNLVKSFTRRVGAHIINVHGFGI